MLLLHFLWVQKGPKKAPKKYGVQKYISPKNFSVEFFIQKVFGADILCLKF